MATARQKKAMEKLVENGGKSVSKAMREAGYSPATAKNPEKLTKSKSWEELLEEYLPDDLLAQKINEGLEANRTISASVIIKSDDPTVQDKLANSRTMDFIDVPDHAVRHKFVETALKIKGKLINKTDLTSGGEKIETNTIVFSNFKDDPKG